MLIVSHCEILATLLFRAFQRADDISSGTVDPSGILLCIYFSASSDSLLTHNSLRFCSSTKAATCAADASESKSPGLPEARAVFLFRSLSTFASAPVWTGPLIIPLSPASILAGPRPFLVADPAGVAPLAPGTRVPIPVLPSGGEEGWPGRASSRGAAVRSTVAPDTEAAPSAGTGFPFGPAPKSLS